MSPEDILIESIAAASLHGDTPALRVEQVAKLQRSIQQHATYYMTDAPRTDEPAS